MALNEIPYGGEINSQPLNENFQYLLQLNNQLLQENNQLRQELNDHLAETASWQRIKVTRDDGRGQDAPNNNLDDTIESGYYVVDSATSGTPGIGGSGSTVICSVYNEPNQEQIYIGRTADVIFFRRKTTGSWQPWVEIWSKSNTIVDSNGFIKAV